MMMRLLEFGLTNAALATVLALGVWIVTRWKLNPHLEALLWLVVAVKLISPHLLPISIETKPNVPFNREATPSFDGQFASAAASKAIAFAPSLQDVEPSSRTANADRSTSSSASNTIASTGSSPSTTAPAAAASRVNLSSLIATLSPWSIPMLAWLWFGGAIVAAALMVMRAVSFNRMILTSCSATADGPLQSMFERLCCEIGLTRIPHLRIVDANLSPLVWGWFGRTVVLVPKGLMQALPTEQQSMVLVHELAHIRRRDHLVRWIEMLVQSTYWWLPLVPWVRHKLHVAQEKCCDAWVCRRFPDRSMEYCEALLTAANWLKNPHSSSMLASEFGQPQSLKRRIQSLLQETVSPPLKTPGRATCWAIAMLLFAVSIRWVSAENPQPSSEPKEPAIKITLVITDRKGDPIPQGKVKVEGETQASVYFEETASIQTGMAVVSLKSAQLDQMTISVDSPGFLTHRKKYVRGKMDRSFTVAPRYEFQIKPGIRIGGTVVTESNQPHSGARIYAYSSPNEPLENGVDSFDEHATTGADGRWEMLGAPEMLDRLEIYLCDSVSAEPGEANRVLPEHHAQLKNLTDVRTLALPTISRGTVVDPTGTPIKGAMALFFGVNFYQERDLIPITDANGTFTFPRGSFGTRVLTIFSPDWALQTVEVPLTLTEPLKIAMRKGKRVAFKTVDEQGKPISGIKFHPEAPRDASLVPKDVHDALYVLDFLSHRYLLNNTTNENGEFVWENAPDGRLGYQITSSEYLCQPGGEYGPSETPHVLTFRKNIPLAIKITDASTGEPIREYKIYEGTHFKANPPGVWSWDLQRSPKRIQPGEFTSKLFTLDRLIRFRVQADGYRPMLTDEFDAANLPSHPISMTMPLTKDVTLSGTVRTAAGLPVSGAKVYTKTKRRDEFRGLSVTNGKIDESKVTTVTTTASDGTFQIEPHVEPYVCFVSHEFGYAQRMDVELFQNNDVTLTEWGAIEGRFTIRNQPVTNRLITLHDTGSSMLDMDYFPTVQFQAQAQTDETGQFRIERCVAGRWWAEVAYDADDRNQYRLSSTVDVVPGQTVTLQGTGPGATLSGRVIPPNGAKIDWEKSIASLELWEEPGPLGATRNPQVDRRRFWRVSHLLRLSPDGRFELLNVAPGTYELTLSLSEVGRQSNRPKYECKIPITPEMFQGKTAGDTIDLQELSVHDTSE